MMWDTPIYRFYQPLPEGDDGLSRYKQVVIDVTGSAPSFDRPTGALLATIDAAVAKAGVRKTRDTILDFGAGKLRNTLYLLEQGYRVCAVEFGNLFASSKQAQDNLAEARRYRARFAEKLYPRDFASDQTPEYQLAILVNVPTIMPVPAERLLLLQQCHDLLVPDGYLLWYSQRGDADYKDRMVDQYRCGDGWYTGRNTKVKQFYTQYEDDDIKALLLQCGFEFEDTLTKHSTWRNQAHLYRRFSTGSPFAGVLTPELIDSKGVVDPDIPDPSGREPAVIEVAKPVKKGMPDPPDLRVDALRAAALGSIPVGPDQARMYEDQVRMMIDRLFRDHLTGLSFSEGANSEDRDVIGTNKYTGLFGKLWSDHDLGAPQILTQCKNARHSLTSSEFDDLGDSLVAGVGSFGMVAYRGGQRQGMVRRCRKLRIRDGLVVLPFDDQDFKQLLGWKHLGADAELDDYLTGRLDEVARPARLFISYAREDQKDVHKELHTHLDPLERQGGLDLLDDTKLEAGEVWKDVLRTMIAGADAAVLLITPNFVNSTFIMDYEVPALLEAHRRGMILLFPVVARRALLPARLRRLQMANNPERPIQEMSKVRRNRAWIRLVEDMIEALAR